MVQRKVPTTKLGIQAEHVKSEKRLGNLKKPSFCQHQDGKNRGADLKKKMKKSRSIKLSDIESLKSSSSVSPLKKTIAQPGKPPPLSAPTIASSPQKQSLIKAAEGSPNYMKSTSSSAARKESSQVSSGITQSGSDRKNLRRKSSSSSKNGFSSGNKPERTLTKTSSLKLGRTLTKAPSFKPTRTSVRKCSRVVLCVDMNAQRATCSSTLKDSKFPAFLMLNPGGTEAEGTSAKKVCPYTYCSLNGHHHAPMPPLKCFLSARRLLLKTQKSMKLEGLSPCRVKPSGNGTEESDSGQVLFDDKPAYKEDDSGNLPMSPLIQEGGMDFFIEIYAKNIEVDNEATGTSTHEDDQKINDFFGEVEDQNESSSEACDEAAMERDNEKQIAESLSDGSPHSEINFEENLERYSDIISIETDITERFFEEHEVDDAGKDYSPVLAQPALEGFYYGSDFEGEDVSRIKVDDTVSEATDMEWEEGQFSASELDDKADYSSKTDVEFDLNDGCLSKSELPNLHDEPVIQSDDGFNDFNKKILADELQQEVIEKESACFNAQCDNSDSEMDDAYQNFEVLESGQVFDSLNFDKLSSTQDASDELSTVEEKGDEAVTTSASTEEPIVEPTVTSEEIQENAVSVAENETPDMDPQPGDVEINCTTDVTDDPLSSTEDASDELSTVEEKGDEVTTSASTKEPIVEPTVASEEIWENAVSVAEHETPEMDPQPGDVETNCTTDMTDEVFNDSQEEQDNYATVWFPNHIPDTSQISNEADPDEAKEDYNGIEKLEDSETDQNFTISDLGPEQELPRSEVGDEMEEKEQVADAELLVGILISDSSLSEANVDDNHNCQMTDGTQLDNVADEGNSNQDIVDESLQAEIQDHPTDCHYKNMDAVENKGLSDNDQDEAKKFKTTSSMDSEEQGDSRMYKISSAENSTEEADKMEVEDNSDLDTAETFPVANNTTKPELESSFVLLGSNSNQELPGTCNNRKWTIKCKAPINEQEEQGKFNPREPNFLPEVPEPDAEKVDLRHQMMDDRKNSEEWMIDYALQQAVTKLAPARKRKVALLVEAFETVMPVPKWETRMRHSSAAFSHTRPIQACS